MTNADAICGCICEEHPDQPWPHEDCAGPGMLYTCGVGQKMKRELDAKRGVPKHD